MDTDHHQLRKYSRAFWVLMFLNISYLFWMKQWLQPLTTGDILSLEIARTVPRARQLLADMMAAPQKLEKLNASIYLDFMFIVMYVPLLIVAVRYLGRLTGQDLLKRAGMFFTVIVLMAGTCDILENLLMIKTLGGRVEELTVRMTYNFAAAKFSMVIMTMMLILVQGGFVIARLMAKKEVGEMLFRENYQKG